MKRMGINKLRVYIRRTNDVRAELGQRKIKIRHGTAYYRQFGNRMSASINARHYNIYLYNFFKG